MNKPRLFELQRSGSCAAVLTAALALGACASTPPPMAQMAVSQAALAHAMEAGGIEFAPVQMTMARDKMSRANAALAAEDHSTALTLAQQAQVDAQVAAAMADAAKARKSQLAVQEASRALREEMARQPK